MHIQGKVTIYLLTVHWSATHFYYKWKFTTFYYTTFPPPGAIIEENSSTKGWRYKRDDDTIQRAAVVLEDHLNLASTPLITTPHQQHQARLHWQAGRHMENTRIGEKYDGPRANPSPNRLMCLEITSPIKKSILGERMARIQKGWITSGKGYTWYVICILTYTR